MSLIKANAHQVGDYTLTNEGGKLVINQGTPDTVLNPVATIGTDGLEVGNKLLSGTSGSSLVGYDGGTVQDVLDAVTGPTGAGSVGYTPSGTGAVATTVQSKMREFVSVKDFGAVGDGVTDDTAAILAALNHCDTLDSFSLNFGSGAYAIKVTPTLWPTIPSALKTFVNKKNITFVFDGATFLDTTTYATTNVGKFLRFENCDSVNFVGTLYMKGSRTGTTAGDRRGMEVVTVLGCDGFVGDIYSDGNSAPIITDEFGFGRSSNVVTRLWSVNSHYCGLLWNITNLQAECHAVNAYRSMFIAGLVNAQLKVSSDGEVGTSLIKAYSATPLMENVSVDFSFENRSDQPLASAISVEFESDNPCVMRNMDIRVHIDNTGASPTTTRLIQLNNLTLAGGQKTTATGHVFENISISGYINTRDQCSKVSLPHLGAFPSGDTVRNVTIKNLICEGSGDILHNLEQQGVTVWDNVQNPVGLTRIRGVSGNNRLVIQNSLIASYEDSNIENWNVDYVNTRISTYSAAVMPIANRSFINSRINDSYVEMSSVNLTQTVTKTFSGDLTGAAKSIFRFVGRVRALAVLDYVLISDENAPNNNQTHGTIRFWVYNTPSGTCAVVNQDTVSSSIGTASVLTLSALNGTAEGFLQFSATNYSSANAFAVFSLRVIPQLNNAERFLMYPV